MAHPVQHLAISVAAGGAAWGVTGEPLALPVTVAAGVLVDGDHVPDLLWNHVLDRTPVVTVVLHGWEWLGALVVVGAVLGFPWWLTAVLVGYGLHLVSDVFFNGRGIALYLLLYRAMAGFQQSRLTPGQSRAEEYAHLREHFPSALTGVALMRQLLGRPAVVPRDQGGYRVGLRGRRAEGGEWES